MPGAPDVARRCFAWPAAHGEDTLGCHHIGMVAVATVFTREHGSDREGFTAFPPLQTEQARFRALRFPVGPVDSGRADSPLPTERCTSLTGPASAFLSASVHFLFDRLALTDLHHVLAITARRWATTPPPS